MQANVFAIRYDANGVPIPRPLRAWPCRRPRRFPSEPSGPREFNSRQLWQLLVTVNS